MRKHLSSIILCVVFLIGLSLLLYPVLSNLVNERSQSRAIATYEDGLSTLTKEDYTAFWQAAQEYNANLTAGVGSTLTAEQQVDYDAVLDPTGTGIMGYVEIPCIRVSLPMYHGVSEHVLQIGAHHLPGSSLPVGGEGTHCVLSGHRGLPSARLFTDLDQVGVGDCFLLHIMDETLAYQVDQIRIVEPAEVKDLAIVPGEDYCTLVTCTPYGVNTHRLLVRGHRVAYTAEDEKNGIAVTADAAQIDSLVVQVWLLVPVLIGMLLILLAGSCRRPRKQSKNEEEERDST